MDSDLYLSRSKGVNEIKKGFALAHYVKFNGFGHCRNRLYRSDKTEITTNVFSKVQCYRTFLLRSLNKLPSENDSHEDDQQKTGMISKHFSSRFLLQNTFMTIKIQRLCMRILASYLILCLKLSILLNGR